MSELIESRETTHGDFVKTARIATCLQDYCRKERAAPESLSYVHQHALDMIMVKVARILSGDENFQDHWDDIAGYATFGGRNV